MEFSAAEKLQISMLCEIFRALEINNSYDPDLIQLAISTNNYWAIGEQYQLRELSNLPTPNKPELVHEILTMYRTLSSTYNQMNEQDKDDIKKALSNNNPEKLLNFPGFDFNHETEYATIAELLKKMGCYAEMNITNNSHMPSIEIYQRMLKVFSTVLKDSNYDYQISKQSFIKILQAKIHPNKR